MNSASRRWLAALSMSFGGLLHCGDEAPEPPPPPPPPPRAALAPDSLLEGNIDAFGLKMPAGTTRRRSAPGSMTFSVAAPFERVTEYLEARLGRPTVERKESKVTFSGGHLLGVEPKTFVYVSVKRASFASEVLVRLEDDPSAVAASSVAGPIDSAHAPSTSLPEGTHPVMADGMPP